MQAFISDLQALSTMTSSSFGQIINYSSETLLILKHYAFYTSVVHVLDDLVFYVLSTLFIKDYGRVM